MDDWTINVPSPEKVTVPSFIRLFVMTRILKHCIVGVDQIKQMVTVIKDSKQEQLAQDILTRLINDGIKKYMEKWFNEKEQIQVIEIIFNSIILKQFEKEYQTIMTYNINGNLKNKCGQYYQTLVFNNDDIMSLIFQFVELKKGFTGDLINCSFVNSHWLYQSWNPNSIYDLCLNTLINNTIKMTCNMTPVKSVSNNWDPEKSSNDDHDQKVGGKDLDRILSSKWQRVCNVKSVHIGLYDSEEVSQFQWRYLLEKASLLRSIVDITLDVYVTYIALLKSLLYYNKKNIERYYVDIDGIDGIETSIANQLKLKPVELIKVQHISMSTLYYYVLWSRRCKTLQLYVQGIDENWMTCVIDNCDCSGVETLTLNDISFSSSLNPETKPCQLLFKKFAQKFNNLQSLDLTLRHVKNNLCLILLLRYLSHIIKQNSTMVALDLDSSAIDCDKLGKMIQDTRIEIYHLKVLISDEESTSTAFDGLKPIVLNNAKLEYLQMVNLILREDFVERKILDLLLTLENETSTSKFKASSSNDELTQEEEKSPLSSLKMIHIVDDDSDTSINTIDQILKLQFIQKHKLYMQMEFEINATHSKMFQESFKALCQTTASLLMSQQNPIKLDIKIVINDLKISDLEKIYYPIFEQYLNQDVANNCNVPIVNKYCNVLPEPVISLTFELNDDAEMRFQVCNVHHV